MNLSTLTFSEIYSLAQEKEQVNKKDNIRTAGAYMCTALEKYCKAFSTSKL